MSSSSLIDSDFKLAINLLNYNIAYLCFTQKVPVDEQTMKYTFSNLLKCLESPSLGNPENPESPLSLKVISSTFSLTLSNQDENTLVQDSEWDIVTSLQQQPQKPGHMRLKVVVDEEIDDLNFVDLVEEEDPNIGSREENSTLGDDFVKDDEDWEALMNSGKD